MLTRETARESLRDSARGLAEQRHREAAQTVESFERRHGKRAGAAAASAAAPALAADPGTAKAKVLGAASAHRARPSADATRRPRRWLPVAPATKVRAGGRGSDPGLERFLTEDRELLKSSKRARRPCPPDRPGPHRVRRQCVGPDRERAEEAIEKARVRDVRRLEVASDIPGRVRGRPRQLAESLSQRREEGWHERRQRLKGLRRERRTRIARRNLSRAGYR